jgi:hypothetical protein
MLFTHGKGVGDIGIWHKRVGHVNLQHLKLMEKQNLVGVAKRKNMHIVEIAHAMLNEKNLPNYFWAKAVGIIVYIMNQTPIAIVHGMTLEEKFKGTKPNVSHLKAFGYIT